MALTQIDMGKKCPFCEDGFIIQYRSGKFGCDKKCWLTKQDQTRPQLKPQPVNGGAILLDELQAFRKEVNERLDSMAQWLAEHLK